MGSSWQSGQSGQGEQRRRGRRTRMDRYPCRGNPGNPTLHYWTSAEAAAAGWFTCACGAVGVCEGCLAKQEGAKRRPAAALAVWCQRHHETVCGKRLPLRGAASLAV
jgi:hypothetical protein